MSRLDQPRNFSQEWMSRAAWAAVTAVSLLGAAGCHGRPAADVVATVNGHAILRTELDQAYSEQLGEAQQAEPPSAEQADSLRLGLLRELIEREILEQRAAKMNLTASNEEVDAKLGEMKAPYNEEQFEEHLRQSRHTLEELRRELRRAITVDKLLNKEINSRITVSDADIANYYNAHRADFNNRDTQWHIAEILVTSAPAPGLTNLQGSKAQSDADARKKIQALKNRVDSGEDFGALAMNFSENAQNSASGGDMGSYAEPDLRRSSQQVFDAISKLKPGQTTDILALPDPADPKRAAAYAIFQLLSKDAAGQHDVTEPQVQQRIRQQLRDSRSQLLKGAYFEMLRDQARVENFFAEGIFKSDAH